MSLGQTKEFTGPLYILKPRTQTRAKEKVDPYFEVLAKNDQGKWAETESVSQVGGDLVKCEHKQTEWEGNKFDNINLTLRDNEKDETYLIELKLTMLTRSLLNSIFNLEEFDGLKISLYTSAKGYASSALRRHGDMVKWRFSLDEIPKPTTVLLRGQKVNDYFEIDQWFLEKVKELSERLHNKFVSKSDSTPAPAPPKSEDSSIKPLAKKERVSKKSPQKELDEVSAGNVSDNEDLF